MRIERWDGDQALDRASQVWTVYDAVFGDRPSEQDWRESTFDAHCRRREFRLAAASEDDHTLAGFAYGYIGARGEYWPDRVAAALPGDVAAHWVGGHFEFVELAVLPSYRRRGIGAALHNALMTDPPADVALLSTDDGDDSPAVRLYRSRGWARLGLLEPGVQVMGWRR
jgi:ribosomal protein S18 acetylase RimI-like enzyme